jgi:tetratricopeptide (TPR) repeat protein
VNANDTRTGAMPDAIAEDAVVRDPYAILGVSRDASYEIIRRSYREKAKHCHPDLGAEPGREEEFKLLNWAHRILAEQRREAAKPISGPPEHGDPGANGASAVLSPIAEILREGNERLRMGAAREAESLARLALQRAREDTAAYVLLAEALADQRRYAEAIGCLLMALQIDRSCIPARDALARLKERGDRG